MSTGMETKSKERTRQRQPEPLKCRLSGVPERRYGAHLETARVIIHPRAEKIRPYSLRGGCARQATRATCGSVDVWNIVRNHVDRGRRSDEIIFVPRARRVEREIYDKPAGFRTNTLICVGATLSLSSR